MTLRDITVREIITDKKLTFINIGSIFDDHCNFSDYNVHSDEFNVKDILKVYAIDKVLNLS